MSMVKVCGLLLSSWWLKYLSLSWSFLLKGLIKQIFQINNWKLQQTTHLITFVFLNRNERERGIGKQTQNMFWNPICTQTLNIKNFYMRRILLIWPLYYLCVFFGFVIFTIIIYRKIGAVGTGIFAVSMFFYYLLL